MLCALFCSAVQNRRQFTADNIMRLPVSAAPHQLCAAAATKPAAVASAATADVAIFLLAPVSGQVCGPREMRLQIYWPVINYNFCTYLYICVVCGEFGMRPQSPRGRIQ